MKSVHNHQRGEPWLRKIYLGGEFLVADVGCDEIFTPEEFTDEQKQIAETTEQFVENEIVPHLDEIEEQNFDLVIEAFKKCGDLGLLMIDTPEAYDGLELDKVTSMLVAEKIAPGGGFLRCLCRTYRDWHFAAGLLRDRGAESKVSAEAGQWRMGCWLLPDRTWFGKRCSRRKSDRDTQ